MPKRGNTEKIPRRASSVKKLGRIAIDKFEKSRLSFSQPSSVTELHYCNKVNLLFDTMDLFYGMKLMRD